MAEQHKSQHGSHGTGPTRKLSRTTDKTEEAEETPSEHEELEGHTKAELKDELAAQDLPTSGTKEELIERLEEEGHTTALVATEREGEAPLIDPPRVYSPFELPADPFAAQAFMDAHPEMVDTEAVLEPQERQDLAEANIQDAIDAHVERGVTVEDPRVPDYEPGSKAKKDAEEAEKAEKEAQKEAEKAEKETADAV